MTSCLPTVFTQHISHKNPGYLIGLRMKHDRSTNNLSMIRLVYRFMTIPSMIAKAKKSTKQICWHEFVNIPFPYNSYILITTVNIYYNSRKRIANAALILLKIIWCRRYYKVLWGTIRWQWKPSLSLISKDYNRVQNPGYRYRFCCYI